MAGRRTLVAEEGGEVVGFTELEGDGYLDMLYEAIERAARDQGSSRIFTEASITARPFFERRGFRVVRE